MSFSAPTPPSSEWPPSTGIAPNPAPGTPWDPAGYSAPFPNRPATPPISNAGTLAIVGCATYLAGTAAVCAFLGLTNDSPTLSSAQALSGLGAYALLLGGGIFSYVTLNLWLVKARNAALAQGYPAPERWKIWAGWLIPFYSLVAPYRVMKELAFKAGAGRTGGPLALWWAAFLASAFCARLTNLDNLSTSTLQLAGVLCVLSLAASFAGLITVIGRMSAALDAPVPLPQA